MNSTPLAMKNTPTNSHTHTICTNESIAPLKTGESSSHCVELCAHTNTHEKKANTPLLIYFNGIIKAQLNDTAIRNCLYNYYNLEECY